MKNLINAIFRTSEERLKNPFISSFIFSFLAFNWKALLILFFSNKSIEEKIFLIESNYNNINTYLILPLVIAFVYIALLPYLMLGFDKIAHYAFKGRKDSFLQQKLIDIKGQQVLAEEEITLENLRADFKEKSDLNRKINNLNSEIEEKNSIIDNLVTEKKILQKELDTILKNSDSQVQNLKILLQRKEEKEQIDKNLYLEYNKLGSKFINDFVIDVNRLLNNDHNKIKINDIDLIPYFDHNLIEKVYNSTQEKEKYYLTAKGKAIIDAYYQERTS